ncbi:MAG: hypothetical protein ACTSU6_00915 [Candidatus Njordarchaeales archaeon]
MNEDKSVLIHNKTGDLAIIDWNVMAEECTASFDDDKDTFAITIERNMIEIGKGRRLWSSSWGYLGTF